MSDEPITRQQFDHYKNQVEAAFAELRREVEKLQKSVAKFEDQERAAKSKTW